MEEREEPPNSKLFTIKRPMNKYKKKDAPPSDCNGESVVTVSEFDYCVDNFFRAMETTSKLCGEDDEDYYALQHTEIQRLSSSLTFLRSCWSKDFVLYVGGHVWTLDWCPRIHEMPDYHIKREVGGSSSLYNESYLFFVHQEGTDPCFVKLESVFRCSMLKCGGIQSIPLTVEWSASPPHDLPACWMP